MRHEVQSKSGAISAKNDWQNRSKKNPLDADKASNLEFFLSYFFSAEVRSCAKLHDNTATGDY